MTTVIVIIWIFTILLNAFTLLWIRRMDKKWEDDLRIFIQREEEIANEVYESFENFYRSLDDAN